MIFCKEESLCYYSCLVKRLCNLLLFCFIGGEEGDDGDGGGDGGDGSDGGDSRFHFRFLGAEELLCCGFFKPFHFLN